MATASLFLASDGDGYELQMGRWSRQLAPKFIAFSGVSDGASVLDVGCGTGNLVAELARSASPRELHAIDFSQAYIDYASSRNADSRIQFQVGDACALPFPDGKFDAALAMLVLQFVPQAEKAIGEMRRVTRPGGTIAAATWDSRGGFVWWRMFWDTAAAMDPAAVERRAKAAARPMARPGDLARAFGAAGLTDVVQDTLSMRMEFASFDDFWAPFEGSDGPYAEYVRTLSSDAKVALRDKVRLAYIDGELDGPRSYMATAWAARGKVPD
ncbi:MAG: class I SAM-dependent methyltransferase [Hyphomicrobiaceae bacterium]|nr:class I SAM-dependent methyltransferase [Hyphomicrobiaceae bacterium]